MDKRYTKARYINTGTLYLRIIDIASVEIAKSSKCYVRITTHKGTRYETEELGSKRLAKEKYEEIIKQIEL